DSSGDIYVSDNGNNRIQKFDSNGKFITKWAFKDSGRGLSASPGGIAVDPSDNVYITNYNGNDIIKFDSNGKFITKWKVNNPEDVEIDSSGNVYVSDYNGVQKFDSNGKFITAFGTYGKGNGQFIGSGSIAIDHSGKVYVTDWGNNRIQVFEPVTLKNSNYMRAEDMSAILSPNDNSMDGDKTFTLAGI